jgi:hypothetical protein
VRRAAPEESRGGPDNYQTGTRTIRFPAAMSRCRGRSSSWPYPWAQGGERSFVQGGERSVEDGERSLVVVTDLRRGCGCDVCPVGVCRTGEPQRGTEDQDRNGECVPDGEGECVQGSH